MNLFNAPCEAQRTEVKPMDEFYAPCENEAQCACVFASYKWRVFASYKSKNLPV